MLDLLAFSPHPDDVELCCGGLLAKMSKRGYRIGIVDLTKGELGTEGTAEKRLQEAAKAADILGLEVRENMDLGDCRLNSSYDEAKKLTQIIRQYRPPVLLAPFGDEHHPDHSASRELIDKAIFLAKLAKVKTSQEPHKVRMVAYYMLHKSFTPSFVVDVTEVYERKLEAIRAYKSQMGLMLGVDGLLTSIEIRDQMYGSEIGVKQGEPFFCENALKIDDPVAF